MGARKRKSGDDDATTLAGPSDSHTPQSKRRKGESDPGVEKRLARFKASCPKNILERVDRVMTQRFFLVERKRAEGQLREEFQVLGSTGNVYTVVIDKLPSCNCEGLYFCKAVDSHDSGPDATKGNHCKHILFVFLKVLSVSIESSLYYQKALLSTELDTLFANAPVAPNSLSNPRIQAAYAKATGRIHDAAELETKVKKSEESKRRLPEEGDDCPVCYDSMHGVDVNTLTFCQECGNPLHTECFQQWARTARPLTCVWCRAKWATAGCVADNITGVDTAAGSTSEGYLNLGAAAGVSPVRDTSSYYHGPRYGQRWGYYRQY